MVKSVNPRLLVSARVSDTPVDARYEFITPEIAYDYLATAWNAATPLNRVLRRAPVDRYARLMRAGLWRRDAGSIKFDTNGILRDGQHRLTAIIEANMTVEIEVRRNIDPESPMFMDQGLPRIPGDIGHMAGIDNASVLMVAALWEAAWKQGALDSQRGTLKVSISAFERLAILAEHPGMAEYAVERDQPRGMRRLVPPGPRCWLMYRMAQVDAEQADEFWRQLISGIGMVEGGAIHRLHYMLLDNLTTRSSMGNIKVVGLTAKAWGLWRAGSTREFLTWKVTEPFPLFTAEPPSERRTRKDPAAPAALVAG